MDNIIIAFLSIIVAIGLGIGIPLLLKVVEIGGIVEEIRERIRAEKLIKDMKEEFGSIKKK